MHLPLFFCIFTGKLAFILKKQLRSFNKYGIIIGYYNERGRITMNYLNLLATAADTIVDDGIFALYQILSITMIILMGLSALTAIVLILLQPSNSSGIDALGGSSETFFGKNKGKSIEEKMKKWTWICLAVLIVFSIAFFIIQNPIIWG